MPLPPNIFISHSTRDYRDFQLAHQLATGLVARGARVWIAPENIPAGSEWREEIVRAIMDGCSHFLVIVSAASIHAKWVLREISLAKLRHESDPEFKVLSLLTGAMEAF